jgi:hypothetical protein
VSPERAPGFELVVGTEPTTVLYFERLRDGRVAVGTRRAAAGGKWDPGEMYLLDPGACLDLAAWLSPIVEDGWIDAVRDRQAEPLRTAEELYGSGPAGVERLGEAMLREISPELRARGLILLANALGPASHERLVQQLNRTTSPGADGLLRRRLADEHEAFAYAVAAAALFDALATGAAEEE